MARVLVVDDDPSGLEIRRLTLERRGHHVDAAANSTEAREAFRQFTPETVILDLRLPEVKDGLALIREFRAASSNVRIVVLSGCSADLDGREETTLVNEILEKPVRSERLLAAVRSAPALDDLGEGSGS